MTDCEVRVVPLYVAKKILVEVYSPKLRYSFECETLLAERERVIALFRTFLDDLPRGVMAIEDRTVVRLNLKNQKIESVANDDRTKEVIWRLQALLVRFGWIDKKEVRDLYCSVSSDVR